MRKKKIALEADFLFEIEKTGVGWHATKIIETLIQHQEYEFYLQYNWSKNLIKLGKIREKSIIQKYNASNVHFIKSSFIKCCLKKLFEKKVELPYSFLFNEEVDINQFFNYYVPKGIKGSCVTIVHDMAYLACPECVSEENIKWLSNVLEQSCDRATRIAVSSQFTKSELIKYLHVAEEKISVIYSGVDQQEYTPIIQSDSVNSCMNKYKIEKPYLLFVGTLEPRKGIKEIVQAFEVVCNNSQYDIQLVLAGKAGWKDEELLKSIQESKHRDRIVLTGYISEVEKKILYQNSLLFLFPSKYEGFGIPLLEAMACGTPIITSNLASIPEVVGEAAMKIEPNDIQAFGNSILAFLRNEQIRKQYIELGFAQVDIYTWENVAQKLLEIYDQL